MNIEINLLKDMIFTLEKITSSHRLPEELIAEKNNCIKFFKKLVEFIKEEK